MIHKKRSCFKCPLLPYILNSSARKEKKKARNIGELRLVDHLCTCPAHHCPGEDMHWKTLPYNVGGQTSAGLKLTSWLMGEGVAAWRTVFWVGATLPSKNTRTKPYSSTDWSSRIWQWLLFYNLEIQQEKWKSITVNISESWKKCSI